MRFRLNSLVLSLRHGVETIVLHDVSYFWGRMGSGKTSIARLVDYCLGGDIQLTPALQSEFVAATLDLSLARANLKIERPRDSDRVIAEWSFGDEGFLVSLPARTANGEVVPGSGVENLSDLVFWLSDVTPPRVRRSKIKQDSATARLSIRDLLWYCYLDQDEIDSSFFHLDENSNPFKKQKSRDVLRFIIGFHDERVAEIEAELDQLRGKRQTLSAAIESLITVLKEVGAESEIEISSRAHEIILQADAIQVELDEARQLAASSASKYTSHAADDLRIEARRLGDKIAEIETAIRDQLGVQDRDRRHLSELETLSVRLKRSLSAKAILAGVTFEACPRCTQLLPDRETGYCRVCGQHDHIDSPDSTEVALIESDVRLRVAELEDILQRHEVSIGKLRRDLAVLQARKIRVERERNDAARRYDSAYLSTMLAKERERASLLQEAENLLSLSRLPRMVEEQRTQLAATEAREVLLRHELKTAREAAESDATNLDRLRTYFLDCLVRSGVPGITEEDRVDISRDSFFPAVYGPNLSDDTITSFSTIGSGGKKTLFKCCFAVGFHRLAAQLGAPLPELLIIDSPMKNISERENREQFEGFYNMLYELKMGELNSTQLILIDKEYSAASEDLGLRVSARHMRPEDKENPPLIPYYVGK